MTTEIDAEGLAAAAEAIDTLWSDGQDRGPAFADTEREYQEHCRSTARAAIRSYLATARTSEAEPVAWMPKVAIDVFQKCEADERLASKAWSYKATSDAVALYLKPLPTPASDDQVEACPVCAVAFKPDDMCLTDIEMGTCHAACLEGAPMVDLETGDPLPEGAPPPAPYRFAPISDDRLEAVALAKAFHETYERLAPSFGYETRQETRVFDPTSPNGLLMVAVCSALAAMGSTKR